MRMVFYANDALKSFSECPLGNGYSFGERLLCKTCNDFASNHLGDMHNETGYAQVG